MEVFDWKPDVSICFSSSRRQTGYRWPCTCWHSSQKRTLFPRLLQRRRRYWSLVPIWHHPHWHPSQRWITDHWKGKISVQMNPLYTQISLTVAYLPRFWLSNHHCMMRRCWSWTYWSPFDVRISYGHCRSSNIWNYKRYCIWKWDLLPFPLGKFRGCWGGRPCKCRTLTKNTSFVHFQSHLLRNLPLRRMLVPSGPPTGPLSKKRVIIVVIANLFCMRTQLKTRPSAEME